MTGLLLILSRHDERALHAVVLRRHAIVDRVMRSATHFGDTWFVLAAGLLLLCDLAPGSGRVGREVMFALVVSHLWVQMLKRSVTRPRPRLPVGCVSLVDAPDKFSFPSGHAAASLSVALPLALTLPPGFGVPLLCATSLVGISRCYLGVHYPGDVLVGWALAVLADMLANPALGLIT